MSKSGVDRSGVHRSKDMPTWFIKKVKNSELYKRYNPDLESYKSTFEQFQSRWKTDVVKQKEKMNIQMKKLIAKLKKYGILVSNFRKLKFVEYKLRNQKDFIHFNDQCANPMVRCRPTEIDTHKESVRITEYYNKRINFLSSILTAVESL